MITVKDGRKIGYAVYGDPNGDPIIYCAGGLGTRLQVQPTSKNPIPHGIRLIGIDRPGLGLSDFLPRRRILDWAGDVSRLADALGIQSFSILGVSSGGAYALACSHGIPDRIKKCGLVACAAPPELGDHVNGVMRAVLWSYRKLPWITRFWFWWLYARHVGKTDAQIAAMLEKPVHVPRMFCETDRRIWSDPEMRRHDLLDHLEAFRQGTRGPAYEAGLWGQPWGFRLEQVSVKRIHLWHGEKDLNSPVGLVRAMASKIPNCEARYFREYGHSVGSYFWDEILRTLVEKMGGIP